MKDFTKEMKSLVLKSTNDFGKTYINKVLKNCTFFGIETTPTNESRKEFTIIFSFNNTFDDDYKLKYTALLPIKDSKDNGCCLYNDFEYFCILAALDFCGFKAMWTTSKLMWPSWYLNEKQYNEFYKIYKNLKNKYADM